MAPAAGYRAGHRGSSLSPQDSTMLTQVNPKLPMRDQRVTRDFYVQRLGFRPVGGEYPDYLMLEKDQVQLHFFAFEALDPQQNYGQVYIRTDDIDGLYQELLDRQVPIHPNAPLQTKPWGQREFSLIDPDGNLLTFGQSV